MKNVKAGLIVGAVLLALVKCATVTAATYYVIDNEGRQWFMNVPSKNGTMPKTLGYVKDSKPHPDKIALRVEESAEKSKCIATALAVCDTEFGGIRLFVNGGKYDACERLTAKSVVGAETGTYATALVPYSGMKIKDGKEYCENK